MGIDVNERGYSRARAAREMQREARANLKAQGIKPQRRRMKRSGSGSTFIHNYGAYLEYGTDKMAAKPWFRPTVRRFRKLANTENALLRLFRKYGSVS